jgi:hypothetical protein
MNIRSVTPHFEHLILWVRSHFASCYALNDSSRIYISCLIATFCSGTIVCKISSTSVSSGFDTGAMSDIFLGSSACLISLSHFLSSLVSWAAFHFSSYWSYLASWSAFLFISFSSFSAFLLSSWICFYSSFAFFSASLCCYCFNHYSSFCFFWISFSFLYLSNSNAFSSWKDFINSCFYLSSYCLYKFSISLIFRSISYNWLFSELVSS